MILNSNVVYTNSNISISERRRRNINLKKASNINFPIIFFLFSFNLQRWITLSFVFHYLSFSFNYLLSIRVKKLFLSSIWEKLDHMYTAFLGILLCIFYKSYCAYIYKILLAEILKLQNEIHCSNETVNWNLYLRDIAINSR